MERPAHSKKRRRPWASCSSITVAATAILLSSGLVGTRQAKASVHGHSIPSSKSHGLRRRRQQVAWKDGSASASASASASSSFPSKPSHPDRALPEGQELSLSPLKSAWPPSASTTPTAIGRHETCPVSFRLALPVGEKQSNDLSERLSKLQERLEQYFRRGLQQALSDWDVPVRIDRISLAITMQQRLDPARGQHQTDATMDVSGDVQVALAGTGAPHFDFESIHQDLHKQVERLSKERNLKDAIQTEFPKEDDSPPTGSTTRDSGANQSHKHRLVESKNIPRRMQQTTEIERPSTLSIVFGFILVALAAAGLLGYCYIFYRKRKKRLRRKKQMKETVQYKMPSANSPRKPLPQTFAPMGGDHLPPNNVDSSDGSSYKGIGSESDDGAADDFARQLQMAASLDQKKWETFKRKTNPSAHAPQGNPSGKVETAPAIHPAIEATYNAHRTPVDVGYASNTMQTSRWTNSFPYGDEHEQAVDMSTEYKNAKASENIPHEEGIEWTASNGSVGLDIGRRGWGPYDSRPKDKPDPLSNESEWDSLADSKAAIRHQSSEHRQSSSRSSKVFVNASDKELEMQGTASTEPDTASRGSEPVQTSDFVLEVQRLAKFVKRYEKKKERRLKRERDREHHSRYPDNDSNYNHHTLQVDEIISVSSRPMQEMSTSYDKSPRKTTGLTDIQSFSGDSKVTREASKAKRDMRQDLGAVETSLDASLSGDALSVSETETESEYSDTQRLEDLSQRLGITPFRVQRPDVPLSFQDTPAPTASNRRMPQSMDGKSQRGHDHTENRQKAASYRASSTRGAEGNRTITQNKLSSLRGNAAMIDGKNGLSALRHKSAILDSSTSDVNLSLKAPSDEDPIAGKPSTKFTVNPPLRQSQKGQPGRGGRNKFQNLRSIFESKPQEAIFPPDQHWQYNY